MTGLLYLQVRFWIYIFLLLFIYTLKMLSIIKSSHGNLNMIEYDTLTIYFNYFIFGIQIIVVSAQQLKPY